MLWYKSWLETRWRFIIGITLLILSAAGTVYSYPQIQKLIPLVPGNIGGQLGAEIRESAALARTFRGFIWSNWIRQDLIRFVTLFSILLGTGGLPSHSSGALFTLSLPVSRKRLLAVRAASGLWQLFVLALVPLFVIPLVAPAIGERYAIGNVFVFVLCAFVAASIFFTLALLLSTMFGDPWRPSLIALGVAVAVALADRVVRVPASSVFRVMSGETWFRAGQVPWGGLLVSAVLSAILYSLAASNLARRDF